MTALTGNFIKDTYKDVLQVSNSNAGVDATLRNVSDGEGTASALQISSDAVNINGEFTVADPATFLRVIGAPSRLQIVGTRTGINGQAGFVPTAAFAGVKSRIRHTLPYGAKSSVLVYGGFKVASAVEGSMPVGGGYKAVSAAVVVGGTGYAVGDVITPTVAANQVAPKLVVSKVTAGVVTKLGVVDGGMFGLHPADALATTGGGDAALTVTLTCDAYVCGLHLGFEQAWNTQTAYSTSALTGVIKLTRGASYNGTNPNMMLPAGDFFYTDPIIVDLPAGSVVGTRVWTNGFGIAPGRTLSGSDGSPALNEYSQYSDMVDDAAGGTFPTNITAYLNSGIQPLAILGQLDTPAPSFVFIGDSITQNVVSLAGATTGADDFDTNGNTGWLEKAAAQQVAWTNFSSSGDRVSNYLTGAQNMRMRAIASFAPSHIVDTLAINDFVAGTNSTNFINQKIAFWTKLLGMGIKEIWVPTCTPRTTSTDAWATTGNQTVTAQNTDLQAWNTWLRAGNAAVYGVTQVIDLGTDVESSLGSGKWKDGATLDGTHPTKSAVTAIVAAHTALFATATL